MAALVVVAGGGCAELAPTGDGSAGGAVPVVDVSAWRRKKECLVFCRIWLGTFSF